MNEEKEIWNEGGEEEEGRKECRMGKIRRKDERRKK